MRHLLSNPERTPRSNRLRFACTISTIVPGSAIALVSADMTVWAYIIGFTLVDVSTLVAMTDICSLTMI